MLDTGGPHKARSLCHDLSIARKELSISVEKTPIEQSFSWVIRRDAARTQECNPLPHTHVYTGGSQANENDIATAGYGVATCLADEPTL